MSRTNKRNSSAGPKTNPQTGLELDPEAIQDIIATGKQRALNDAERIKLRQYEIEKNAEIANKSLDYHAEHLKHLPDEQRKLIKVYAAWASFFLICLLSFTMFCIYLEKTDFILNLFDKISYLIIAIVSYFVGKKNGANDDSNSKQDNISHVDDAEIVD